MDVFPLSFRANETNQCAIIYKRILKQRTQFRIYIDGKPAQCRLSSTSISFCGFTVGVTQLTSLPKDSEHSRLSFSDTGFVLASLDTARAVVWRKIEVRGVLFGSRSLFPRWHPVKRQKWEFHRELFISLQSRISPPDHCVAIIVASQLSRPVALSPHRLAGVVGLTEKSSKNALQRGTRPPPVASDLSPNFYLNRLLSPLALRRPPSSFPFPRLPFFAASLVGLK
ncbi:hypothetical protein I7I51_08046 [Histoplasma capsulatum]|uniref:Uncharacterized protein n=1 Tax=Ajellomyces capsulatus TaxID=5037 RepID=A0A8A1LXJ5_AJECA|nr:hypothetical protein I7I51_08046 [Histoplasma capsulatum]